VPLTVKIKPTEQKLVVSLLEAEHPDVDALASEVIRSLKEKWVAEDLYVVNMYDPNMRRVFTYGPFGTPKAAEKEMSRLCSAGPKPSQGWVCKLREIPE
jgi:hypothetical protein